MYEFDNTFRDEAEKEKIAKLITTSLQDYEEKWKGKKEMDQLNCPVNLDYIKIPDKKKNRKDKKKKKS